MLTPHLKETLDEKWDNCWPVSNLRPIAILDLISYLYFIKKTDELDLISQNADSIQSGLFVITKEVREFTWARLKNLDAPAIHELFCDESGIVDLMSEYGKTKALYADYFKAPLLLKPTPKLLFNLIEINNIIESADIDTQSAIAEYLLSKVENAAKEPQFLPQNISRLLISIADPKENDIICDLSTGYGNLLVNAAEFIKINSGRLPFHFYSHVKGMESNINQLRIAAMRMMLHNIKHPDLKIFNEKEIHFADDPTLFISDLFYPRDHQNENIDESAIINPVAEREIILLQSILQNLKPGARAVILVTENFLKSNIEKIQKLRKEIVDNNYLEGVIHLFPDSNSSFVAGGILIFSKHFSKPTDKVWFGKMDKPVKRRTLNDALKNPDAVISDDLSHVNLMLDQWKNRGDENPNSFFINEYDIKTNNYNLNYNDYKLLSGDRKQPQNELDSTRGKERLVATKKENLHHFFEGAEPLQEPKRKRKIMPVVLAILVLLIAGGWFYLYSGKNNFHLSQGSALADSTAVSKIPVHNSSLQPSAEPARKEPPLEKKHSAEQDTAKPTKPKTTALAEGDSTQEYTVVNKAWFHYAPDSTKRKPLFLQPREDLVLIPTAEENGFVYVVYVNKKGQSTHGWLDKRDLEPLD